MGSQDGCLTVDCAGSLGRGELYDGLGGGSGKTPCNQIWGVTKRLVARDLVVDHGGRHVTNRLSGGESALDLGGGSGLGVGRGEVAGNRDGGSVVRGRGKWGVPI